jgi:Domain of Unknown Function (DUF928)
MSYPHWLRTTIGLCLMASMATLPTWVDTVAVNAQPPKPKPSRKIRWKPPTPPSSLGTGGQRGQGGGQRGDCKRYADVTALVPLTDQGIYWGQTTSDRPTLWFNTPQGLEADLLLEVVVREMNGKPIAKQLLMSTPTDPGVISIPFPTTTLMENHLYRWEVVFYCDAENPDKPITFQGQLQRVAGLPEPLASEPLASEPLSQAQMLADRGIWFDALTQLGNARRSQPSAALTMGWNDLLQSAQVKLKGDQQGQINDCCQLATPSSK